MNTKFVIILLLVYTVAYISTDCFVDIDVILKINDTAVFIKGGKLHNPEKIEIGNNSILALKWITNEMGLLFCGIGNNFVGFNKSEIKFKCASNDSLVDLLTQKVLNLKNIKCASNVKIKVKSTNTTCDFGNIINIGFENQIDFYKYIEVCYDYNSGSTKYTKHIIAGKARQLVTKKKNNSTTDSNFERSTFSKEGLPYYTRQGEPYTKANQISRFGNIVEDLGSNSIAFNNRGKFLAKGHLTPVADGIFNYLKRATMFFINAAPEWQVVNAGNWLRVENIARCIALNLKDDLEVITGIAGILKLPNSITNQYEELYLTTIPIQGRIIKKPRLNYLIPKETQDDIIPVPKYFWKVLKYQDKSIAFITLNNPYANEKHNIIAPCNDICRQYGYSTSINNTNEDKGFENFDNGRTYCCEVGDLVAKFPNDMPHELRQYKRNILKYVDNNRSC